MGHLRIYRNASAPFRKCSRRQLGRGLKKLNRLRSGARIVQRERCPQAVPRWPGERGRSARSALSRRLVVVAATARRPGRPGAAPHARSPLSRVPRRHRVSFRAAEGSVRRTIDPWRRGRPHCRHWSRSGATRSRMRLAGTAASRSRSLDLSPVEPTTSRVMPTFSWSLRLAAPCSTFSISRTSSKSFWVVLLTWFPSRA